MRRRLVRRLTVRFIAALLAMGAFPVAPALAQDACQRLQQSYQRELGSAESLKSKAAQQAMQSGSQALTKLGIQLGSSVKPEQAVEKGALAATSPQMQGAIIIQLLSANAHLQEMVWRGCKPSG